MPEITGVRLQTTTEVTKPKFAAGFTATRVAAEPCKTRRANLGDGWKEISIYHGPDLSPGHFVRGPGIIEETFTTIVVYPGWEASIDDNEDYELHRKV